MMRRSKFNRRAAAAARRKTSGMVEIYFILERAVSAMRQAHVDRRMVQPPASMQGRFGTYQLRYESLNWGDTLSVCVTAPDGRKLAAHIGREAVAC